MTSTNLMAYLPTGWFSLPSLADDMILPTLLSVSVCLLLVAFRNLGREEDQKLPMLNPKTSAREFMTTSKKIFIEGRKKFPGQPYLMNTYLGNATILPTSMLDEVRNMTELDFWPAVEKV